LCYEVTAGSFSFGGAIRGSFAADVGVFSIRFSLPFASCLFRGAYFYESSGTAIFVDARGFTTPRSARASYWSKK